MAVKVSPTLKNPTHDISFIIKGREYGFLLDGGPQALREIPFGGNPPTSSAQGKFGDYEPEIVHIEQRDWSAGRGSDDFSKDHSMFLDSRNAFTMVPDYLFPAPQWRFGTGIRTTHENLPGSVNWQRLTGNQRYVSSTFTTGGSGIAADNLEFWIRRIGSPGTLTAEVWTNSGGNPSALVASATKTVTTSDITDWISELWTFDLSAASNLGASTIFHVVLFGASTDDASNYWEVGVDTSGSASKDSSAGSSWATSTFSLYFRLSDTDIDRKWHFFEMDEAMYAVDQRADEANSKVYMNGERGRATGSTNTTLVDTNNGEDGSWVDDQWNGYYIKITAGTGKGQRRLITDTSASGNSVTVAKWDKNPSTDSDYVIYGGAAWQNIGLTGDALTGVVQDVMVFNKFAFFAMGSSQRAHIIRYDNGDHDGDIAPDDARTKISLMHSSHDPVDGPVGWLARNSDMTITRMNTFTWAAPATTDLGSAISVGGDTWEMTNVIDYDGQIYVPKVNGLFVIANDRATRLNIGFGDLKSNNNGEAVAVHQKVLYLSWAGFTVMRLVGNDAVRIGPDRGIGLPDSKRGKIVAMTSETNHLLACIESEKRSSVMVRDDGSFGWHEIFSGWGDGKKVQNAYTQAAERPILWLSVNGDIVYQEWPKGATNPLEDPSMNYQHEAVLTLADIDLGSSQIPKFFKEMNLISENLTAGIEVYLEAQTDEDIGGTEWQQFGAFHKSEADVLKLHMGDVKRVRFRLRLLTNSATVPPVVKATVLEGSATTPIKYRYPMRLRLVSKGYARRGKEQDPNVRLDALKAASQSADRVIMNSIRGQRMHNIEVKLGPIFVNVESEDPRTGLFIATVQLEARDA